MANWHREQGWTIDTPDKQKDTMIDMVRIRESRDDVERYAWFMGRWDPDPHFTSIFEDEPGVLTPLGNHTSSNLGSWASCLGCGRTRF